MNKPKKKKKKKLKIFTKRRFLTWNPVNMLNSKWPVSNFTAKRTPKVKGRIIFLIISITFKRGTREVGLPEGVKCEKYSNILFDTLERLIINQKIKPKIKVFTILEETLIVNGIKFQVFIYTKNINKIEIINLEKITDPEILERTKEKNKFNIFFFKKLKRLILFLKLNKFIQKK